LDVWHKCLVISGMLSNREISRLLSLYAELLQLHDKEERLSHILSGAAFHITRLGNELALMSEKELQAELRPETVKIVLEVKAKGTIETLDELIQLTPAGLFDMMRIKGLGGKKLHALWYIGKIDNVNDLLAACKSGTLDVPGFGQKSQQNIIKAIEALNEQKTLFHYASVADSGDRLVKGLQTLLKTKLVSLCGAIRRQTTTVEFIELIMAVPSVKLKRTAVIKRWLVLDSQTADITNAHTLDELPVTIYHTNKDSFNEQLFRRTGTEEHVNKVLKKIKGPLPVSSETAIYEKAKLPYIVPEMREDAVEWSFHRRKEHLLTVEDIKGVVHNHTDWSDGVDSLEAFVSACRKKGYQYCVVSDHSKNAHYAGGLKEKDVRDQIAAIAALNEKLTPFKIFTSIECDILVSGELDYDAGLLSELDMVIVSVHQLLRMDEQKATKRLIKAIENPYTTILGHMTGRQLLIRPGYPVNFKKVIDACAANGVIIEVNANPYRLDVDWSHLPYAIEKEVLISIDPDAHSIAEIDNIRWGVSAARKGGLTKEMTWNAQPLDWIEKYLKKRKARVKRKYK
jgi:DNA polymerase (family 10)